MSDGLLRVVYVSRNCIAADAGLAWEIDRILEEAQTRNAANGVTGALNFNRGVFGQVLEGPSDAVEDTFELIEMDDRHADVTVLSIGAIAERAFGDWAMGFVGRDMTEAAGFGRAGGGLRTPLTEMDGDAIFAALHGLALKRELVLRVA